MLGWIVLRGRSLFPAILAHFLYDACLLGSGVRHVRTLGVDRMLVLSSQPMMGTTWPEVFGGAAVGTLMLAVGFWLCRRSQPLDTAMPSVPTGTRGADEVVGAHVKPSEA